MLHPHKPHTLNMPEQLETTEEIEVVCQLIDLIDRTHNKIVDAGHRWGARKSPVRKPPVEFFCRNTLQSIRTPTPPLLLLMNAWIEQNLQILINACNISHQPRTRIAKLHATLAYLILITNDTDNLLYTPPRS